MRVLLDEHPSVIALRDECFQHGGVVEADVSRAEFAEPTALGPVVEADLRIRYEPVLQVQRDDALGVLLDDLVAIAVGAGEVRRIEDEPGVRAAREELLDLRLRLDRGAHVVVQPDLQPVARAYLDLPVGLAAERVEILPADLGPDVFPAKGGRDLDRGLRVRGAARGEAHAELAIRGRFVDRVRFRVGDESLGAFVADLPERFEPLLDVEQPAVPYAHAEIRYADLHGSSRRKQMQTPRI